MRRTHGTGCQYGFPTGFGKPLLATASELDADTNRAGWTLLDTQTLHMRTGHDVKIAGFHRWSQKCLGSIPANAALLIDIKVSAALIVATVEIINLGDPNLCCSVTEGVQNLPRQPLLFNAPFTTAAMKSVAAQMMIFTFLEQGQDLIPAPAVIAAQLRPFIIITRLTTHVDHAVDGRTATQYLATWINQTAAVQTRISLTTVQPVGARIIDAIQVTDRDVNPDVIILGASFNKQNPDVAICAQAIGQHTASSSCTNDDVIVLTCCLRLSFLSVLLTWLPAW